MAHEIVESVQNSTKLEIVLNQTARLNEALNRQVSVLSHKLRVC